MDDEKALTETAKLVTEIMLLCKEYANKDGLDFLFVVKTTAEAMLKAIR
jgi:hypothetical protein